MSQLTRQERDEIEHTLRQVFGEPEVQVLLTALTRVARRESTRGVRQELQALQNLEAQLVEGQRTLQEALVQLTHAQVRTEERVQQAEIQIRQLTEAQQRTEERVGSLEEGQRAIQEAIVRLAHAQERTEEQIRQLTEQVQGLLSWQRGEAGRREGERYEREILRQAPFLFVGGEGGAADQPEVRQRLTQSLQNLLARDIRPEDNPFLADLLWWKGKHMAVVEASLKVNGQDVLRATHRAATIRQSGASVTAVVIGEEWASPDTVERARALGVDWKVGSELSPGLLAFRQLPTELL